MRPIIIRLEAGGTVRISAEELEKIVSEAYEQGVVDGKAAKPTTAPSQERGWLNNSTVYVACKAPEVYL